MNEVWVELCSCGKIVSITVEDSLNLIMNKPKKMELDKALEMEWCGNFGKCRE